VQQARKCAVGGCPAAGAAASVYVRVSVDVLARTHVGVIMGVRAAALDAHALTAAAIAIN
jgi:hypothetical protein